MKTSIVLFVVNIENLETLNYHIFLKKTVVLSIICSKCNNKNKIFNEEESIKILKTLNLIINIEEYQNEYD